ncbi:MAG: 4Fe-4S dicluster domain-containing protein [Candidatus Marinimicrobia bacterium]|nr:4Fe-4S dicluster domain-containing protein [Candidatus Neomarinimicrobiota bacterium]
MIRRNSFLSLFNNLPVAGVCNEEIIEIPDPDHVVLPLEYSQRELYIPRVKIGDHVRQYQIIATNSINVCLHAPISGKVLDIKPVWSEYARHVPAICIEKGVGDPLSSDDIFEQYGVSRKGALPDDQLKAMGIFPPWLPTKQTEPDTNPTPLDKIKQVVVVGMDEEPSICVQHQLLIRNLDKVSQGFNYLNLLMPKAQQSLLINRQMLPEIRQALPKSIQLKSISAYYPARILDLLIPQLTNIKFDLDRDYVTQGVMVITVEKLLAMLTAFIDDIPFTHKYLTVSQRDPLFQKTVRIIHGASIRSILESLELDADIPDRIIAGGPMKGMAQFNNLTPMTRSSNGIHLMYGNEAINNDGSTCINCGRCVRICPMHLQVHLIARNVEFECFTEATAYHPQSCIECGLCDYVCPAQRPLVQMVQLANKYGNQENEHKPQTACSIESPLEEWEQHCATATSVDHSFTAHN